MEREKLNGNDKGKGARGSNHEAESADALVRGGLPHSGDNAGKCPWSEAIGLSSFGACQSAMGGTRNSMGEGSLVRWHDRMTRECQILICEGRGETLPPAAPPPDQLGSLVGLTISAHYGLSPDGRPIAKPQNQTRQAIDGRLTFGQVRFRLRLCEAATQFSSDAIFSSFQVGC